jgi:hypothetical protein
VNRRAWALLALGVAAVVGGGCITLLGAAYAVLGAWWFALPFLSVGFALGSSGTIAGLTALRSLLAGPDPAEKNPADS